MRAYLELTERDQDVQGPAATVAAEMVTARQARSLALGGPCRLSFSISITMQRLLLSLMMILILLSIHPPVSC